MLQLLSLSEGNDLKVKFSEGNDLKVTFSEGNDLKVIFSEGNDLKVIYSEGNDVDFTNAGRDRRTDGHTKPHMEMRGRI